MTADIDPRRGEAPLANFMQRRQPWVEDALCAGLVFYIPPFAWPVPAAALFFPEQDGPGRPAAAVYDAPRSICAACPVRVQCGTDALEEERNDRPDHRHGLRAYMTPAQRISIERQGGLHGRDPMKVVIGTGGKRPIPGLPDEGDNWSRHHTTLARKTLRWLVDNVAVGAELPTQSAMCTALECNPSPLRRVMEALVQDGTLDMVGSRAGARGANGTTVKYVRRRTPRRIMQWQPMHIPATVDEGSPT